MSEPKVGPLFFLFIAFFLSVVRSQNRFDCEENFCKKSENQCPEINCENGRIVKNATVCGCCNICIESLGEGKECSKTEYGWNQNFKECGPGLYCNASAKCDATECLNKFRTYSKGDSQLKVNFTCDYFGNYDPVVCLGDALCFCVNEKGMRIFGTDIATRNKTMNCKCSRDVSDFPKEVKDETFYPRCLSNGNYDHLQCTQDKCFCTESSRTHEEDVPNDASSIRQLSCYSNKLHENGRTTSCLREKEKQMKLFKENQTVIGMEAIRCDLDGSYFPVQCNPTRCFCVSRSGKIYDGYSIEKKNEAKMTCRCLRDKELLEKNNESKDSIDYIQDFECDSLGNYGIAAGGTTTKSFFEDFK